MPVISEATAQKREQQWAQHEQAKKDQELLDKRIREEILYFLSDNDHEAAGVLQERIHRHIVAKFGPEIVITSILGELFHTSQLVELPHAQRVQNFRLTSKGREEVQRLQRQAQHDAAKSSQKSQGKA